MVSEVCFEAISARRKADDPQQAQRNAERSSSLCKKVVWSQEGVKSGEKLTRCAIEEETQRVALLEA